jgi:hypothetical protein
MAKDHAIQRSKKEYVVGGIGSREVVGTEYVSPISLLLPVIARFCLL